MNVKTLIAAVALAVGSAPAFAAGATPASTDVPGVLYGAATAAEIQAVGFSRTREAVIAELEQARASGESDVPSVLYGSATAAEMQAIASSRTRDTVIAELKRARTSEEWNAPDELYGEFAG